MPGFHARAAAVGFIAAALVGCSAAANNEADPGSLPAAAEQSGASDPSGNSSRSYEGQEQDTDDGETSVDEALLEPAFVERDEFFDEQQVPPGEMLTKAATQEQKNFIESQRDLTIASGGEWREDLEQVALALTFDACETAILNSHEVDVFVLESHLDTSPLYQLLLEDFQGDEREALEVNLISIMVHGTSFLCPADYDQWFDAAMALYPDFFTG